jgi:hypothetical protein
MYKILIFLVLGSAISALIAGYQGPEIARPAPAWASSQIPREKGRRKERENPNMGRLFLTASLAAGQSLSPVKVSL